jgi:hypothetical protein
VMCGNHRRHVRDPAARYLAGSEGRPRTGAAPSGRAPRRRSSTLGTALVIAVIPLAIGLGVLVGRSSNNGDGKLIAALRNQQPDVITTSGGTGSGTSTAASASTLTSTFPLSSGYAVELQTLPATGTTASSVTSAEASAKSDGATSVGLILQSDFKVTPTPPAGAYVIYAGAVKTQSAATKELSKLRKKFPKAVVIHVQPASSGQGKVLSSTKYGTAHQITGCHEVRSGGGRQGRAAGPEGDREELRPVAARAARPDLGPVSITFRRKRNPQQAEPATVHSASVRSDPALEAQRESLTERFALMQSELGGLFYEMAIRDHVQMDVLIQKAAELQRVDGELGAVERLLDSGVQAIGGRCEACGAIYAPGAAFCAQCARPLTA